MDKAPESATSMITFIKRKGYLTDPALFPQLIKAVGELDHDLASAFQSESHREIGISCDGGCDAVTNRLCVKT